MSDFIKLSQYGSGSFRERLHQRLRRRKVFALFGQGFQQIGINSWPKLFLAIFVFFFFLFSFSLAVLSVGLPNPASLAAARPVESTKIYDRNGVPLYDIFSEKKKTAISFAEMPESLKEATVAVEDAEFYQHAGINLRGVVRGLLIAPFTRGQLQGGSSITQQFVKNAFLTPRRTLARKLRELILAIEVEQVYTKDRILEMYLNEIPYGGSAYGVSVAAEMYFGKKPQDLTLAQSALLAAIPQAPTFYSPYGQNVDALMARKDFVLKRMLELSYITEQEYEEAKAEKIEIQPRREAIKAPHFVFYVRELLAEKYGERFLEQGGLKIYTTLDYENYQKVAEEVIASRAEFNAKNYLANNAALVSLNPETGEILAMVGSRDYFNQEIDGQVNVAIRPNQPGSAIKPIIYAEAFRQGMGPATLLLDVKTDFGQGYSPNNYDGEQRGPVSLRQALANSINIPAVKTLALVGVKNATALANEMGIASLNDPDRYGLSLVLGGGDVTLLELTSAYGVFATTGVYHAPVAVLKVEDKRGKILEEFKPTSGKKVLDPQVAYLINDILSDDAARALVFGMGGPLTIPGQTVAAKTGTTDGFKDAWTVGYTPKVVSGVWVGNNDNRSMNRAGGSIGAAPIWNGFMRRILANEENLPFPEPEGIVRVTVDSLSGKLPTDASPSTKTEIFTSWGVPKEKDDLHVRRRVVALAPDKLAPEGFPQELTEERIFTVLHSERPDYAPWENPVIAWAKANGYNNVPTEYYSGPADLSLLPELAISSPGDGAKVEGEFKAVAVVRDPASVKEISFFYDSILQGQVSTAPYEYMIKPPTLDNKKHELLVRLTKLDGSQVEKKITITAKK